MQIFKTDPQTYNKLAGYISTDMFSNEFKNDINSIKFKPYKKDSDKEPYKTISFDENSDRLQGNDKEIFSYLMNNQKYRAFVETSFQISLKDYIINYNIIRLNDNSMQPMITGFFNKKKDAILGYHLIPLNENKIIRLYHKNDFALIDDKDNYDYNNYTMINADYSKELLFASTENQYFGFNNNIEEIKYLIIKYKKK